MADPRFFTTRGPFRLDALAALTGAVLGDETDAALAVVDIAPLDAAAADCIGFLDNKRYLQSFADSAAGACIVHPDMAVRAPRGMALLLHEQPYVAYARVAREFYPIVRPIPAIAPSAVIDESAKLGPDCRVDAGAVIAAHCEIGARCHIAANATIDSAVVIGDDCRIGANVSLSHCIIGNGVVLYPGARVGQDGFGFATEPAGHLRIPQVGRVLIHDHAEIGANTTIDRGSGPDTVIGAGCMIDNLVQIAHNVQLGKGCVLVSQVGISGSTKLGDYVVCGGQAGFSGHLEIGDRVTLAARSGVIRDLASDQTYGGAPAISIGQWKRQMVAFARLAKRGGEE